MYKLRMQASFLNREELNNCTPGAQLGKFKGWGGAGIFLIGRMRQRMALGQVEKWLRLFLETCP